jgi:hypothetical protein
MRIAKSADVPALLDAGGAAQPEMELAQPARARRYDELSSLTTAELRAELARRQQDLAALRRERDVLVQQLAALDRRIQAIARPGGDGAGPSTNGAAGADLLPVPHRWEAFDTLALPEAIARLMAIGDVTSPQEATDQLLAKGYGTRTKSLRTRVTQVLASESRFQRVARGRYERLA